MEEKDKTTQEIIDKLIDLEKQIITNEQNMKKSQKILSQIARIKKILGGD